MNKSIERLAEEACVSIGAEYKDIAHDGQFHSLDIADDPRGRNDARLKIFSDRQGGIAWNHKSGERQTFFINRKSNTPMTVREREEIKRKQQRREKDLKIKQGKAANRAQALWGTARPASKEHSYIQKKHINPGQLRQGNWTKSILINGKWQKITIENTLLVPLYNQSGTIRNLQGIFPEKHPELGREKDFLTGGELTGLFWWVGGLTDTVILAEGMATASSINQELHILAHHEHRF